MMLTIPVNSINTGNETRDKDLITGDSWFHATKFPFILFETTSAEATDEGGITLFGNFTMNGVTKKIVIPFQKPTKISRDWAANQQVDYSATLSLNRKDYDIKGGDFWDTVLEDGITQLSDSVTIELDIHTRRPDYEQRFVETDSTDIRKTILEEIKLNGIQKGMALLSEQDEISAGALTTIVRTLLVWEMNNEAIGVLQKAISKFPENQNFYNLMGVAYLKQKEYKKANTYFEKVLLTDPHNTKASAYKQLIGQI